MTDQDKRLDVILSQLVYIHYASAATNDEKMAAYKDARAAILQLLNEADKRSLETLSAILSGSGKNVQGQQLQDEKRTIEIAQTYIHNKLLLNKEKDG